MTLRRFAVSAAAVALVLLSPFDGVEACGPDFEPDVFVRLNSPDQLGAFSKGQLGILQSGFDSNEYAVAFRYLNGGRLSDGEREIYAPERGPAQVQDWTRLSGGQIASALAAERQARSPARPPGAWRLARAKFAPTDEQTGQPQSFPTDLEGNIVFDPSYLNCPDPAFQNAVLTLNKRADAWGKQSPWLLEWIRGQDAVFSNCSGKTLTAPAAAPADSPALFRADRAYQLASAFFYAKQFDQAARQFEAVAQDKSSPWSSWGEYLAARATVRKAFAMDKQTDPYSGDRAGFDEDTMRKAQRILEVALKQRNPAPSREMIVHELNFIRIRTEPEKRVDEICAALAGPNPDENFGQDLSDLSWVLMKHIALQNPPPLLAWIAAWRGSVSAASAFATWQQSHTMPWLVMAIAKSEPSDAFTPELLQEAAQIGPGTPAYDTVFYHRVRLLIGLNRGDEARSLLDGTLLAMRSQQPSSNENSLLAERLSVARDFQQFLAYTPRKVVLSSDTNDATIQVNCGKRRDGYQSPSDCPQDSDPPRLDHSLEFDEDAVFMLNRRTPIQFLVEAASSPNLPPNLQQDLVLATWTRSVVLEDSASAAKLAPLLPKSLRESAGTGVGFSATLTILRNPGLRPFLSAGVSRLASFNVLDEYRDNWWGVSRGRQDEIDAGKSNRLPLPSFFTKEQQITADAQCQRLQQLPYAAALLGQRTIDYARDHPDNPEVPEALALTVRATHYTYADWGKDSQGAAAKNTAVSKAAFQLLHSRYPKSLWAIRTHYYY
jgi:hypothetical protein